MAKENSAERLMEDLAREISPNASAAEIKEKTRELLAQFEITLSEDKKLSKSK